MKALILLFSLMFVACLVSCGKDKGKEGESAPTPTTPTTPVTTNLETTPKTPKPTVSLYESPTIQGRHPATTTECNADNFRDFIIKTGIYNCDLRGEILIAVVLPGANLRGADLRGADLLLADLTGADLRGADLYKADLREADLRGADLTGADLTGVNLNNTKVTQDQADYLKSKGLSGFMVVE